MGAFDYYCEVAGQAMADTIQFFKPDKRLLVSIFMFLLGLVFWQRYRGSVGAMDKLAEIVLFILVPGAITFFILFAWNLFLAPVRLHRAEAEKHRNEVRRLELEADSLKTENDADFLRRNPVYRKYELIANLALAYAEGRTFDEQGGFAAGIETPWTKTVERLLGDLGTALGSGDEYLWLFQQDPTLNARLRNIESILSNLAPPTKPD